MKDACERTLASHADLRWGPDGKGFRRIVHANGACLTGVWEITEDNPYSGYFRKGSKALVVGRYSTSRVVERGKTRSLALVGKLFPTSDPHHAEPLRTANFFVQQDIGGDYTDYLNDVELCNAPDISPWRQGSATAAALVVAVVFGLVEKEKTMRQIYPVAELGLSEGEAVRSPLYMRLVIDPAQPRIEGQGLDIRDEIMAQIYDKGDPTPKRKIKFFIEVTDDGETKNILGAIRRKFSNWRRIGTLTFDDAVVSYNGDFVLHYGHPRWRDNPNDPASVARPSKVQTPALEKAD